MSHEGCGMRIDELGFATRPIVNAHTLCYSEISGHKRHQTQHSLGPLYELMQKLEYRGLGTRDRARPILI